ncbi:hypothetical protein LZ32DRAFT_546091 [Colletotrichum eremochloae]|nr:hypothetical protein LZ32DRAFT_546091 [Colletotrichum eremochloae]
MPVHPPTISTSSSEFVFADDTESFALEPMISDVLRTRSWIPGSIFLVEHVESLPVLRLNRWKMIRLILGDGQLCLQALVRGEMHRFVDVGLVRVGCYVRLVDFSARFQDNLNHNEWSH